MNRRLLLWGSLVVIAASIAFWFAGRAWGAREASGNGAKEVGAAFLGLLLIVGAALGFDMRDWF